jgi:hypothetical protein
LLTSVTCQSSGWRHRRRGRRARGDCWDSRGRTCSQCCCLTCMPAFRHSALLNYELIPSSIQSVSSVLIGHLDKDYLAGSALGSMVFNTLGLTIGIGLSMVPLCATDVILTSAVSGDAVQSGVWRQVLHPSSLVASSFFRAFARRSCSPVHCAGSFCLWVSNANESLSS